MTSAGSADTEAIDDKRGGGSATEKALKPTKNKSIASQNRQRVENMHCCSPAVAYCAMANDGHIHAV